MRIYGVKEGFRPDFLYSVRKVKILILVVNKGLGNKSGIWCNF